MISAIKPAITTAIILLISITVFSCDRKKLPPQQVLKYEEANTLEEEFKETRANVINQSLGFEDTRDHWFSLDSLKKYIDFVEYEVKKQGHSELGLRVYFGAYSPNSTTGEPGYSTVFFVPTSLREPSPLRKGFFPIAPRNLNIDSIPAFNYGGGGQPPNDY
jgi:hypothetical protein